MIHPRRDLLISLFLFIAGLAAIAYAALAPGIFDDDTTRQAAAVLGGFAAVFGALLSLNFFWAGRIARRITDGDGVIATWTIPAAQMRQFIVHGLAPKGEYTKWTPAPDTTQRGLVVNFGPETVVVDGALLSIPSEGMQCLRAVHVVPATPPVIVFTIQIADTRGSSRPGHAAIHSTLRIPAPDMQQAEAIRRYYQDVLDGKTVVAPQRWTTRIRIARRAAAVSAAMALGGIALGAATGWQTDSTAFGVSITMMAAGTVFTGAAQLAAHVAGRFHRTQYRTG